MNPMMILVFLTVVATAIAGVSSTTCAPQTTKPIGQISAIAHNSNDSYVERFSKMFRGYVQEETDGKPLYVPLRLITANSVDHGESIRDPTAAHVFDYTLVTDCSFIDLQVTKVRPSGNIVYAFKQMQYQFGQESRNCTLKPEPVQKKGIHTYACIDNSIMAEGMQKSEAQIATLIIERMDLDKFLSTVLPEKYTITWE